MTYLAKWGRKGFLTSPQKLVPFENLSTAYALKQDTNKDTSGTPSTNTKGRELQKITLETSYAKAMGTDPRAQLDEWNELLGAKDTLYIGGKQFGPDKLQLTNIEPSEFQFSPNGEMIYIRIKLTFTEYQAQAAAISTKPATATSAGKTTTTTNNGKTLNKVAALSAKASTEDKTTRKPSARWKNEESF